MSYHTHAADLAEIKKAIFIVGVSRSGTTLMRRTLNQSAEVAIADENHFLGHLIASEGARHKFRQLGDLSDDENVKKLVDFIYDGGLGRSSKYRGISRQWVWIAKKIDKADFLQRILASDRSERSLFTIMMQVHADRRGKSIIGEKTPAHIRYVPTLLEWFPCGRIIHMLRDPRAIFVSELRRRTKEPFTTPYKQLKNNQFLFKLYIVLQTTIVWFESVYRYSKYKNRYPDNYLLLKFEDFVNQPREYVGQVCDFIGIDFQEAMMEQIVVSRGFELGQKGFDSHAAERWRSYIDPWIDAWFKFWFKKYLKEFGYID